MSASTTVDIFCDRCEDWTEWLSEKTARAARRAAAKEGWRRRRNPDGILEDVCDRCIDKAKAAVKSAKARARR